MASPLSEASENIRDSLEATQSEGVRVVDLVKTKESFLSD
jgi:hypothetical protein